MAPLRDGQAQMIPLLTLFTTCKPFKGEFGRIQRNALQSWAQLTPACEIIVFGDETGVDECCKEFGLRHIRDIPRTEYGTPLLDGLFQVADGVASTNMIGFVNADIMLTMDLLAALKEVRERFINFLLIGRRWNAEINEVWDFSHPEWEKRLRTYIHNTGRREPVFGGVDLFVYPRGMWKQVPHLAIGRGRWDSALIYTARKMGVPVVDATQVMTCVHQNHSYSHISEDVSKALKGPEAIRNTELLGGPEFIFTSLNATHVLRISGISRQIDLYPPHLLRRLATLPALYRPLYPLKPLVRRLLPLWKWLKPSSERRGSMKEQ